MRKTALARAFRASAHPYFERRGFRALREQTVSRWGVRLINFVMEKDLPELG